MQKAVKMSLKGKTSGNGQMGRIFMLKKIDLGVILSLPCGFLYEYDHYSQTKLLVYISVEH